MTFLSLGLILLSGFLIGLLLEKIKVPGLVGMIIIGLIIGPYLLNLIDPTILNISSELRQIALIIILTRSGLNLDIESLKRIGRPAILMSFIPATFEIIGVALFSYLLLNLSIIESLLLGSCLAAVSPAVVSPRMIKLIENHEGDLHNAPKLVLAGSSIDDIYAIILFYTFLSLNETNEFNFMNIIEIPTSIILGIILGLLIGFLLSFIFKKIKLNNVFYIIITLSISLLLVGMEKLIKPYINISSLLSIMVIAMVLLFKNYETAKELSKGYNSLWKVFEIILFVLVGASLNLNYLGSKILPGLLVLSMGLLFRAIGVILSLIKTNLTFKEKIFSIISYLPKATVQASIGGIALSSGLACGEIVLTISILSILVTAPIGAFLIDNLSKKLLYKE